MQAVRFMEILNKVCTDLLMVELATCLTPIIQRQNLNIGGLRKEFNKEIFQARDNLAFLNRYPEIESVLSEIGIKEAFDSNAISRLLYILQSKATSDQVYNNAIEMADIQSFYFILLSTLRLRKTMLVSVEQPRMKGLEKDEKVVEFEVLPIGEHGFKIERIEAILPLIDNLYKQLCIIHRKPEKSPEILYMDSGSGIVIGLKGGGEIIDALRNLFVSIWDKIRFKKHDEIERNLETIDSSLDVLKKIKDGQTSGSLSDEDAARLKHLVVSDIVGLLENGASLREMQKPELVENRKLLTDMVAIKYLTDGSEAINVGQTGNEAKKDT